MFLRTLMAVLTIATATSCVPLSASDPKPTPKPKVVADPRQLLRQLDLDVPEDVAALATKPENAADLLASPSAAPAFLAPTGADDRARAEDCLAAAIYYEARSEPLDGQRAVAQVVLNRVRDRAFPKTVCGVVYQGHERRTGCQFSFTCDGSMLRRRNESAWERSRLVADQALAGYVYAPAGSATHYHASYMLPWWAPSLTRIGLIGSQVFYRWRSGMERALTFRQQYAGFEPAVDFTPAPGAEPVIASDGGITVHYGGESAEASVVIHHNATPDGPIVPVAQLTTYAGVRVHRNVDAPGGDYAGEAIVSDDGA
jgi:hypothetical protein